MAKMLMTGYKPKVLKLKFDEDPLQSRIYFPTFMESLEMMFSQYKDTCEVFIDYPKIGGEDIKYYVDKEIRNLILANIDSHSRRLIYELPVYGVKCISKLQPHFANMTFSNES